MDSKTNFRNDLWYLQVAGATAGFQVPATFKSLVQAVLPAWPPPTRLQHVHRWGTKRSTLRIKRFLTYYATAFYHFHHQSQPNNSFDCLNFKINSFNTTNKEHVYWILTKVRYLFKRKCCSNNRRSSNQATLRVKSNPEYTKTMTTTKLESCPKRRS